VVWLIPRSRRIISLASKVGPDCTKEIPSMLHDVAIAFVFLAMIIAPALIAMRSGNEESDQA
jgi:hypothetical protein